MSKMTLKPLAAAMGAAFVATAISAGVSASENPFAEGVSELSSGYMLLAEADTGAAEATDTAKAEEGKCGEGKCGEKKAAESTDESTEAAPAAEGSTEEAAPAEEATTEAAPAEGESTEAAPAEEGSTEEAAPAEEGAAESEGVM